MAGRNLLSIFQQLGVPAFNRLQGPACQIPVSNPEACRIEQLQNTIENKRRTDLQGSGFINQALNLATPILLKALPFVPVIGTASSIALKVAESSFPINNNSSFNKRRTTTMWPFDGESSIGDVFNNGLSSNSGFDFSGALNTGVGILGNIFGRNASQGVPMVMQTSASAGVPIVRGVTAIARMGSRRFPELMARLSALRMTRSSAYSMLKRLGPAALVGMGFASQEVAQLASSGSGYRRMNICNGRALRRASRRIDAFHKFYRRTCGTSVTRHKRKKC